MEPIATRYRLIRTLADGRFHSGERLAADCGVTRAAVWKQLQGLRELLDLEIHAVPGRGYRLARPLELLDPEQILQQLPQAVRSEVRRLVIHDRIDSTNAWLLARRARDGASGTVCLAEQQTAGRGRRGRGWISPFAGNICLSLAWQYDLAPTQLSGLSLAAGLAALRAVRRLGVDGVGLKWPNDLYARGRKLAGLLLEIVGEAAGPTYVVLGVGINVSLSARQGSAIDQPWVDLVRLPGVPERPRNRLAALLVEELVGSLRCFAREGLSPLMDEWNRADLLMGRRVSVQRGEQRLEGIHRGIDEHGALLLARGGRVEAVHAGEVSLRGDW